MRTLLAITATGSLGIVLWGLSSSVLLFAFSRVRRPVRGAGGPFRYIFVIPALNEGSVIGETVRHLVGLDAHAIVVVDDGSDDDTAEQVRSVRDSRVVLVQRRLPDARQGKGAALNEAYHRILQSKKLAKGQDPARVVMCVIDADGRLDPRATAAASAALADDEVGACQVCVTIRNRKRNVWTAMQHFEFVAFAHMFQRGREWTGAVGLGGNGQFVRLSALDSLGAEPWSACLTEDMDLGIRLRLAGWRNRFLPGSSVSQQAVPDLKRLVRQRTRWFQGTLQCLRHLPAIVASPRVPLLAKIDLIGIVVSPLTLLAFTPLLVFGLGWLGLSVPALIFGGADRSGLVSMYAVAGITPLLLSYSFWRHEPDTTPGRALMAGHAFALYSLLWVFAGWAGALREVRGFRPWMRTARVEEPDQATLGPAWRMAS